MLEIDISTYTETAGDHQKLQHEVLEQLGEMVFVPTYPILCFHILKCIAYPGKAALTIYEASIEAGCQEVKQIFEAKFDVWENGSLRIANTTIFEQVALNLADLEKLPGLELNQLEEKVKEDIARRDLTIQKYEQLDYIKKYKAGGEQPRNHDERTLLAFYTRNLDEQQLIIRYLLNDVKTRALTKCRSYFSMTNGIFQSWGDRPYYSALPFAEQHFDHEKIDRVSNRLLAVGIKEGRELKALYDVNKKEFYDKLFVFQPVPYVINSIKYYFDGLLPLTEKRKELFAEMLELYEQGKYYGFYGLALSQVEGLFTEMLARYGADAKKGKSLPEKVKALRDSAENQSSYFDYYEFYIPLQRNKFMHAGIDDEIELKAHDLLFDLMNILFIYVSLNAPVVVLTQMIKKRDQNEFINEEGFSRYFKLVEASSKNKTDFDKLETELESFEKGFLVRQLSDNGILDELATLIPQTLNHLAETVRLYTGFSNSKEVKLDDWTMQRIHTERETMVEELKGVYEAHKEIFEKLNGYAYFIHHCNKHIPSLDKQDKQKIENLVVQYKDELNRIGRISAIIQEAQSQE